MGDIDFFWAHKGTGPGRMTPIHTILPV